MKIATINDYTKEELFELAFTDALTKVYSRNALKEIRKIYDKLAVWITIVDVDNLGLINDAYGHLAGDLTLQKVVKQLQTITSNIIRLGGDEFLLLTETEIIGPILGVSYGSILKKATVSFSRALAAADEEMYQVKKQKHNKG